LDGRRRVIGGLAQAIAGHWAKHNADNAKSPRLLVIKNDTLAISNSYVIAGRNNGNRRFVSRSH
jgi:hypothetical protein